MTRAPDILTAALGHMQDRAATYDKPEGERSMPATVAAFNAATGRDLTAEEGWLFAIFLKAVRSQQGGFKQDNYEDGAAYFALMGEQAAVDRKPIRVPTLPDLPPAPIYPEWATHSLEDGTGATVFVRRSLRGWEELGADGETLARLFTSNNMRPGSLRPL